MITAVSEIAEMMLISLTADVELLWLWKGVPE
jgi:hypothetical protein